MHAILKRVSLVTWIIPFMIIFTIYQASAIEQNEIEKAESQTPARHLVVTYFHTTFRCPTCHKIEELSAKAVKTHFEDELKSGKVVWQVINVDEPGNKHFVTDYSLYSKHLIVSEMKDSKEVRWKDLKDVWTYVKNDQKFDNYVKTEIADWLKE